MNLYAKIIILLNIFLVTVLHFDVAAQPYPDTYDSLCYTVKKFEFDTQIKIQKKWQGESEVPALTTPIAVDITGDGIPEILTAALKSDGGIIIYNIDGTINRRVNTYRFHYKYYGICVLNYNDRIRFIVAVTNENDIPVAVRGKLVCYNLNGSIHWISDHKYNDDGQKYDSPHISLADFNQDGIPEVFLYNEIFNATTGVKLGDGGRNGYGYGIVSYTLAVNIDDDPNDLELVGGYSVYKVVINNTNGMNGNQMISHNIQVNGINLDGPTAIVDINGDGFLDVVVQSRTRPFLIGQPTFLYAYDFRNNAPNLICFSDEIEVNNISIGKTNNSGKISFIGTSSEKLVNFEYDEDKCFKINWEFVNSDRSGFVGCTLFDIDGNGLDEILIRDEKILRVVKDRGRNAQIVSSVACESSTQEEKPIIFGSNSNHDPIICLTCASGFHDRNARITVFGPANDQKWAPARNIWNQYAYNPIFINDDGTAPKQILNPVTYKNGKYNNFNVQESYLDEKGNYPSPAASIYGEISCVTYDPENKNYTIQFTVFNRSDATLPASDNIPVSFYSGDPASSGVLLTTYRTINSILPGANTGVIEINFSGIENIPLWMIVNTDRFPVVVSDSTYYSIEECDYTDNVFIVPAIKSNNINRTICSGETYQFHGQTLSIPGLYNARILSSNGCDSLIEFLELEVSTLKTIEITQSTCDSYIWNGQTYDSSGTYHYTTKSVSGCDSIITLNLSINPSIQLTEEQTTCESYEWNGQTYTSSGIYSYKGLTSQGCDSTVMLNLTIHPKAETIQQISVCDNYEWNGQRYDQSGTYTYNGHTKQGCDSTAILELVVVTSLTVTEEKTACDQIIINGITLDTSGDFPESYLTSTGCDSIHILRLTINQSIQQTDAQTTCESYEWNGQTYTSSGIYSYKGLTSQGCDSTVTLNLTIHPKAATIQQISVCDSYEWNGQKYDQSGTYTYNGHTKQGCDSTAILELVVATSLTVTEEKTACDQIIINGITLDTSGDYSESYMTNTGCDSTHILRLTIHTSTQSSQTITVCEQYNFFGSTITESGIYRHTLANQQGCDSLITLDLRIAAEATQATVSACGSYHWVAGDTTITSSGTYTARYLNQYGCDSTITLSLNIALEYDIQKQEEACGNYTWQVTKERYTTTGIYSQLLKTTQGCDSLITLDLTIHPEFEFHDTVRTTSPYYWELNGQTYDKSGIYTELYRSEASCDSLHVLHLRVNYSTDIYFPNIITGEGRNGYFTGYSTGEDTQIRSLSVFDRWGNRVFHREHFAANEPEAGWNGKFDGKDVAPGVYIWTAQIMHRNDDREETFSGDVTVVR